jgi:thymidylate synthase (FAD)
MKIAKQAVDLIDHCGSDLSVVNAARVSFHKESDWEYFDEEYKSTAPWCCTLSDKDTKLITYLAKHKHFSPFNHCFMSFRVKAPIFVARQLVKHKFLPWNEVSRRYVDEEPEFYFPEYWRKKADNVKQGSSDEEAQIIKELPGITVDNMLGCYTYLLSQDVCAEQARMILPQNMMTEWIWSGTLGAFASMCKLRTDSHTQQETREVAQMISDEAVKHYPVSWKALLDYGE